MLTANRVHQFLNSAYEWESMLRQQMQHRWQASEPRIAATESSFVLELDLPGQTAADIDVEIEKNVLTISLPNAAEAAQDSEAADDSGTSVLNERVSGHHSYKFQLPFRVDADQTELSYQDGVLRISAQQHTDEAPRKLSVK